MKSVHYTCDRCREPIQIGRAVLILEGGPAVPWTRDAETGRPALDLCGPCLEDLSAWLRGEPGKRDGKLF